MTAVFVHGVPDTHRLWNRLRALLDRDDVVAPDLPGFGCPVPAGFGATKEEYADFLTGVVEAVAARSGAPVDLVGHDWGSMLVQRVLITRPDLLRTVAFGACVLDPTYVWHDTAQAFQTPEVGEQVVAMMTPDSLASGLPATGVPPDVAAEIGTHVDDTMRDCVLRLYRSAVHVYQEWALPVPSPVPTLVIAGVHDPYVAVEHHRRIAEQVGASLLALDCNHWWPLEEAQAVATALQELWASER